MERGEAKPSVYEKRIRSSYRSAVKRAPTKRKTRAIIGTNIRFVVIVVDGPPSEAHECARGVASIRASQPDTHSSALY